MPAPANTLLIEGSFDELSDELAQYIDNLRKAQGDDGAAIQPEVTSLIQQNQKDEALKKLVGGAAVLNSAPEKGRSTAYGLKRMHAADIISRRQSS